MYPESLIRRSTYYKESSFEFINRMRKKVIVIISVLVIICGCKEKRAGKTKTKTEIDTRKARRDSLLDKLNENIQYFGDSLLKNRVSLVKTSVLSYQFDSCGIVVYDDTTLRQGFEGIKFLKDLNGNGRNETVFILPPFNYCDDGDSYYFFDTTLPRLHTDSYCCHPENLFSIGDIDEDGVSEICIFYSSCVSRFKSLIAYRLKNNEWEQIGRCTFDINSMKPSKETRVRKTGKGKFEMLEIIDGNKEWRQFSI